MDATARRTATPLQRIDATLDRAPARRMKPSWSRTLLWAYLRTVRKIGRTSRCTPRYL